MPLKAHERDRQWLTYMGFGGGLNADLPPAIVPQGQLVQANSVTIRRGILERMGGCRKVQLFNPTASVTSGPYGLFQFKLHQADGSIDRWTLVGWDSELVYFQEGGGGYGALSSTPPSPFPAHVPMTAAQHGNRMIITNGVDEPMLFNGSFLERVNCPPPPAPTNNVDPEDVDANGHLVAGAVYGVIITYCNTVNRIDESPDGAALTRTFVGAAGDNVWKIDLAALANVPDRYGAFAVYRTRANQKTYCLENVYDTNPATGLPFVASVGATDITVGNKRDDLLGVALAHNQDMPKFKYIFGWDGRIFGCGLQAEPTQLGWSRNDQPCSWLMDLAINLDQKDGYPLTGLADTGGRLYAWKKNCAYLISSNPTADATLDPLGQNNYAAKRLPLMAGLLTHWGVAKANDILYGLGDGILWSFDGANMSDLSYGKFASRLAVNSTNFPAGIPGPTKPQFITTITKRDYGELLISRGAGTNFELYHLPSDGLTDGYRKAGWLLVAERNDGSPWILMAPVVTGGVGYVLEMFEDSTFAPIITDDGATLVAAAETGLIDPAPTLAHKLIQTMDVLVGAPTAAQPDGVLQFMCRYRETPTADDTDYFSTWNPGVPLDQWLPLPRLTGAHRRGMSVMVTCGINQGGVGNKGGMRILGFRIGWKPVGDLYPR